MRVSFGTGHWVAVEGTSLPGVLYVRFQLKGDRLKPSEIYLHSPDATIDSSDVRNLPLDLVEAVANDELGRIQFYAIAGTPSPDLPATLAPLFEPGVGEALSIEQEFRLTHGPTDGLTDEFLRDVARAYRAASLRRERPNLSIQQQLGGEAAGIPLKTVQRWVYTARQRGIMPKGEKGKAS